MTYPTEPPGAPSEPPTFPSEPPTAPDAAAPGSTQDTTRPSRTRTVTHVLIGALVGAAAVGAAWYGTSTSSASSAARQSAAHKAAASAKKPAAFTLNGTFTLTGGARSDGAGGCTGTGGYDDITPGVSVTVYDAAGKIVAVSSLLLSTYDETSGECSFPIAVEDVPAGQDFYQIEIGHRGKVQLTAADARSGDFEATLG